MNLGKTRRTIYESEATIKGNEGLVGMGVWNIGNELKNIRDIKSYTEKGYNNFEEYVEKELNYSRSHCYNFISIAEKYNVQSIGQIASIGMTKLLTLSELPTEERQDFIKNNSVKDMTTRELKQAIKEKKQAEQKNKELETEIEQLKHQEPKVIQKEVETIVEKIPDDYNYYKDATHKLQETVSKLSRESEDNKIKLSKLEGEKSLLERKVKLNEEDSNKYKQLKSQIENLSKQKDDLGRRIKSVTELSGLVVRIEHILKTELAPIKYSRAIREASTDEMVTRNLKEIIDRVQDWCNEMYKYTEDENIIDSEVIYHE